MKVPVATSGERSASVSTSAAGGGGNTKGKKKNPRATPKPVPSTPPMKKIAKPRQKRMGQPCSIRAREPAHGELDAVAGEFPPTLDFGQVGRLGKAAQQLARLFARRRARQGEGLAPEGIAAHALAVCDQLCCAAGDVGGTADRSHGTPRPSIYRLFAYDASRLMHSMETVH